MIFFYYENDCYLHVLLSFYLPNHEDIFIVWGQIKTKVLNKCDLSIYELMIDLLLSVYLNWALLVLRYLEITGVSYRFWEFRLFHVYYYIYLN